MHPKLKHPFRFLYWITFFFSMQYGLVLYINSSFLELSVGEKIVGLVFTIAALLSILVLLEMPRILNRFGNYKTAIFFAISNAVSLILLGTGKSGYTVVFSFFLYTITNYSLFLTLDVFIGDYTLLGEVGRTRGLFLTIRNFAILLSPLAAVFLLAKANYFGVYVIASLFTLVTLFFIFPHFRNFPDPIYKRIRVRETFKKILGDANLKKIYATEFLLCFFYSWMIIYTPIYLREHVGLSWSEVGIIFTIMLIPFALVEYPLGRLSDKMGEKKILSFGFLIISFATLAIFFIKTQNIFTWALVLFITRIGAATIEVMNESYFFTKIRPSDAGLISFFRNMFPLSFVISPLIAIPVLLFIPSLRYLYIVLGAILFSGFFISLRLRDVK
jgi:MFS family permease